MDIRGDKRCACEDREESDGWLLPDVPSYAAVVEPLIDGEQYMEAWADAYNKCGSNDVVLHSGWRVSDVVLDERPQNRRTRKLHELLRSPRRPQVYIRLSGHAFSIPNAFEYARLRIGLRRRVHTYLDQSFASSLGSFHQKSTCFTSNDGTVLFTGSVDLNKRRRDSPAHVEAGDVRRPSHDVGVLIRGEAAAVALRQEMQLWTTAAYYRSRLLFWFRVPSSSNPLEQLERAVPSSIPDDAQDRVQLLRQQPRPTRERAWMYASFQEATVRDAFYRAIARAKNYIYIEDQYFCPNFGDAGTGSWTWYDSDTPMELFRDAITRGVQLIVVLPSSKANGPGITRMRDGAVDSLRRHALSTPDAKWPVIAQLFGGHARPGQPRSPVHVHSKLLLCDDEYALVGSANVNGRSFVNDVELSVGIEGPSAASLRRALWSEHLERPDSEPTLAELIKGVKADARLVEYVADVGFTPPGRYKRWFWRLSEPSRD